LFTITKKYTEMLGSAPNSGLSSLANLSCNRTELKCCTETEIRWSNY